MQPSPLILVPGLLCDERLWEPVVPFLKPVAACMTTDLHTREGGITAIAAAIADQAPPRFSLAGLSMGGYIALEICRRFPERVERLALLDTSARPDTPEQTERRKQMIALSRRGRFDKVVDVLFSVLVHEDRLNDNGLRNRIAAMARHVGPDAFVCQQEAIIDRIDQRPNLSAIACPTLVICGRQDRITPLDCAEEMAAGIPGAGLHIIETCGHMSTMEQPKTVGKALQAWMSFQ